jgi:methionine biosynthesis protein MetW
MDTKNFEDNRWHTKEQGTEFRHLVASQLIENGSVLDVGCGAGTLLDLLKQKGIEAEGVDISEEAINICLNKGYKVTIMDMKSGKLPFPDRSFDQVVLLDVLEHLYNPEHLLAEARRVAKSFVIVGVPNFNSLPARLQMLAGLVPENNRPGQGHIYWFNYGRLKEILAECNLKMIDVRMNTFGRSYPLKLLMGFLNKLMPQVFALSFVVRARKR